MTESPSRQSNRVSDRSTPASSPNGSDNELLLAQQLLESGEAGELPESVIAQLSPDELEQFMHAREGLDILNRASSIAASRPKNDAVTRDQGSLDTLDDWIRLDDEQVPRRIGRFEIKEELGRGGFGVVLRATDPRLDRDVALKIPRASSLLHPELLKRFQREARAAALLSHPGIVPIFETDRIGPFLYITYEYVEGKTLSQLIREETTLEPILAARLMQQLADSVQYAHSRGLVHRDLKPANVLIDSRSALATQTKTGKPIPKLRITDFGLAELHGDSEKLTAENALVGTPSYLSPEQAQGKTATARSDLYSLGVILYELLTGAVPFQGESHLETVRKIADEQPMSPHRRAPSIPKDISAICLKCLEKTPESRYASCQELADDLVAFLDGRPTVAREIGRLGRLIRWSRRNSVLSISLLTLWLVLLTGIVSTTALWRAADQARESSVQQSQIAQSKSKEALTQARMTREAIDQLHRAIANEPAIHEKGMESFKLKMAESAQRYYERLAESRPNDLEVLSEYVDTLRSLALLLQRTGRQQDSAVIWREAANIVAESFPDDLLRWVALRSKLSEDLINSGEVQQGVQAANELVDRLKNEIESSPLDRKSLEQATKQLIVQLINAAQNLKRASRFADAKNTIDEAVQLCILSTGKPVSDWPSDRIWARALRCQAEIADSQDDWKTIGETAQPAIKLYERLLDDPKQKSEALSSLSLLHQNLANSERLQKNFDQAIAHHEKSADYLQQLIERHPDAGALKFNWSLHVHQYSRVLWESEAFDDAYQKLSDHLPQLETQKKKYPQLHWLWSNSELDCRELMAKLLVQRGELDAALLELDRAIAICEEKLQSNREDIGPEAFLGHLCNEKAMIYCQLEQVEEAEKWLSRSIATLQPIVNSKKGGNQPRTYLERAGRLRVKISGPDQ